MGSTRDVFFHEYHLTILQDVILREKFYEKIELMQYVVKYNNN